MPQLRMPDRQPRDPRAALRVGDIGDQPVVVNLFERERNCDDAAVELGYRDLTGHVERAEAVVVVTPLIPRAGQTQALQDRDVQGRKVFDVPAVVVAPSRRRRWFESPGGQHGDHHGVGVAELLQQLRFGGAQRRAVHGQRPPARVLDRPAQRLDVGGVAGQMLRAVVEHRDRRAGCAGVRSLQHAPGRGHHRRRESEAGHQHGVRQEGVQLAQVVDAAVRQVDVRLHGDAGRRRVDRPVSSASAACSPLTSTVGMPLAITVSMPLCQAR